MGSASQPGRSSEVARALQPWFSRHRRRFAFRSRPTPYKILLAEILLRKTRGASVNDVFQRIYRRYPRPAVLASAEISDLRRMIAPIGLPNRATTLVSLGRALVTQHGGRVPHTRPELLALPGVGPYAAGAVLSAGFGVPTPMVDGPIGRVLRRFGGIDDNGRAAYYDKRVWALAEQLLPETGVREYQFALLDLSALLCRPGKPLCSACPLENICSYAGNA